MLKKGSVKHTFPGGNTSKGFYSYYHYILGQEEATRIISLKGGPGVGKSSFMKRIGAEMLDRGYDVEYMHCSSDPNSLDAVAIPSIKVAILDGTAPHVVDPKNPGAVDEILHLGDYWIEKGIRQHKNKILKINAMISKTFARAYKYLAAAKSIYDDIVVINKEAMNPAGVSMEADKILCDVFSGIPLSNTMGKTRKLFSSAITPEGLCNYLDSVVNTKEHIFVIKGAPGTGTELLLSKIADAAVERGLDIEAYYCPIEPETKIEHIVISNLNVAFTTSNKYHETIDQTSTVVDMDIYLNKEMIADYEEVLAYDTETFDMLLTKAIETIKEAKKAHDLMEEYYIPNMRFDEVDLCLGRTLQKILMDADQKSIK